MKERVSQLASAARKLPFEEQQKFLDAECGQDEELRQAVTECLAQQEQTEAEKVTEPISDWAALTDNSASDRKRIGPYRILQSLGAGGMGQVYMAEQQSPIRRRVALKIIKTDAPSKEILARFEAERQALAMMDHQNIARVLDAGITSDGRPYFAMELVKGVPITEYCDHHKLNPNERLGLFVQACRAIQHAHQKGIVHRDIKPSNMLVALADGKPITKVIDFGLAKALIDQNQLTNRTLFTQFGQVVGTLAYMSPEQAEMNAMDVDTRTDVYSLGVILYELLTGSTPITGERIRSEAFDRVLALIREEEATRPSARLSDSGEAVSSISELRKMVPGKLVSILKGDLDWIAMKALEKDRTRRYDTPAALADDVERFLDDETIEARPPAVSYRMSKYCRKHRGALLWASFVLALTFCGLVAIGVVWLKKMDAETQLLGQEVEVEAREAEIVRRKNAELTLAAELQREVAEKALKSEKSALELNNSLQAAASIARKQSYKRGIRESYNAYYRDRRLDYSRSRLLRTPKELRGWEFDYLYEKLFRDHLSFDHGTPVTSLALNHDNSLLVSGSAADASVKVWDLRYRRQKLVVSGTYAVLGFLGDRDLVVLANEKEVFVQDLNSNKKVQSIPIKPSVFAFAELSGRLVAAQKNRLVVFDLLDKKIIARTSFDSYIMTLATDANGIRVFAKTADGQSWAFDSDRNETTSIDIPGSSFGFSLSTDGKSLAYIDYLEQAHTRVIDDNMDRTVGLSPACNTSWGYQRDELAVGLKTGEICILREQGHERRLLGNEFGVTAIEFGPGGRSCAIGDRAGIVTFWESTTQASGNSTTFTGEVSKQPLGSGHYNFLKTKMIDSELLWDDELLALTNESGVVRIVDAQTGKVPPWLDAELVAFNSRGHIVGTKNGVIKTWRGRSKQPEIAPISPAIEGEIAALVLAEDSVEPPLAIATKTGEISINMATTKTTYRIEPVQMAGEIGRVKRLVPSPDESWLAVQYEFPPVDPVDVGSGSSTKLVRIVSLTDGTSKWTNGNTLVGFLSNDLLLLGSDGFSTVHNCKADIVEHVFGGRILGWNSKAGKVISEYSDRGYVRALYGLDNGELVLDVPELNELPPSSFLAFSSDGTRFFSYEHTGAGSGNVGVFDAATGERLLLIPVAELSHLHMGNGDDSLVLVMTNGSVRQFRSRRSSSIWWRVHNDTRAGFAIELKPSEVIRVHGKNLAFISRRWTERRNLGSYGIHNEQNVSTTRYEFVPVAANTNDASEKSTFLSTYPLPLEFGQHLRIHVDHPRESQEFQVDPNAYFSQQFDGSDGIFFFGAPREVAFKRVSNEFVRETFEHEETSSIFQIEQQTGKEIVQIELIPRQSSIVQSSSVTITRERTDMVKLLTKRDAGSLTYERLDGNRMNGPPSSPRLTVSFFGEPSTFIRRLFKPSLPRLVLEPPQTVVTPTGP